MKSRQINDLAYYVCLVGLGLTLIIFEVNGENERTTYAKIYEKINGALACFRRFNGTHQIGCASKSLNGDNGILHLVEDDESLNWVIKDGPHPPYIAVMHPKYFIPENMRSFQETDRVSGVLLMEAIAVDEPIQVGHFSTDLKCPNRGFGFFNNTSSDKQFCPRWNLQGNGILYENWDFPVFFIHSSEDAQFILKCYADYNKPINGTAPGWPLCASQLQSFMLGAVDTPTCIRRSKIFSITPGSSRVCDPLGDFNIHAPLIMKTQNESYTKKSVIVIGARMDAASMFDKISPGADTAATGLTTLLAVIKQLSRVKEQLFNSANVENVYFILFQGEAFDYIGSSRIVYDMSNNNFPYAIDENSTMEPATLKLESIKYFIEIGQVAPLSSAENIYYLHRNWRSSRESIQDTDKLVKNFQATSLNITFKDVNESNMGLPPSSYQSFLKVNPNIPGLVVTNHEKEFKNPFYNSVLDTDKNLGYSYDKPNFIQERLSVLAAAVASTVWKIADLPPPREVFAPDGVTMNELLKCYIKSARCNLFNNITSTSPNDKLEPAPYQLYVGVNKQANPITLLTRSVMVYYQGTNVSKTENECSKSDKEKPYFAYYWLNGTCFETTVNTSEALSPAFIIDGYNWKSGQYSTWTESVWQKLQVRVFLKPSLLHELLTLCFGIATFLVSLAVIGWVNWRSDDIFSESSEEEAIVC